MSDILKQIMRNSGFGESTVNASEPETSGEQKAAPAAGGVKQRSTEEQQIIEMIHSGEVQTCFGGYLFRRLVDDGIPVFSFAVENMDEEERYAAEKHYRQINSLDPKGFLTHSKCHKVERYTVFDFYPGPDRRNLREWLEGGGQRYNAEVLMKKLAVRLVQYDNTLTRIHASYYPLNCLSLDTVFLDANEEVYILPLMAHKGRYPIEIPREVSMNQGGTKSDLFSAAYVSVEFASGGDGPDVVMSKPRSQIILSCLQMIPEWRPDLVEVYNVLKGKNVDSESCAPATNECGNRTIFGGKAGRSVPISHKKVEGSKFADKLKQTARAVLDKLSVEEWETAHERDDTFEETDPYASGYHTVAVDADDDDLMGEA